MASASEQAGEIEALTSPLLTAPHGFFTRRGGVSTGIYASLNCGFGAKDDQAAQVAENRRRAAAALGAAPERLVTAYQIHSADAVAVAAPWTPETAPKADGLATAAPGIALGALSADCAPVLLEDAGAGVVGACHSGWRGALDGVIEATLAAMERLGAARSRIRAAVGPCIGPEAYEVGPEFRERFLAANTGHDRFFRAAADEAARAMGKARFDLPGFVVAALRRGGVAEAAWIGRCTYAEEALFFSNRRAVHRGDGDYGRLLSAIRAPDP
ncbi:MAG: peptidoglycan editing factor PgeF [Pseudomonadota bacterium]